MTVATTAFASPETGGVSSRPLMRATRTASRPTTMTPSAASATVLRRRYRDSDVTAGSYSGRHRGEVDGANIIRAMEGSAPDSVGTSASWLRCYRCWSQNLEVQVHYEGVLKVDPETGLAVDPVEEVQEAVVQCLDCLHDQPHLNLAFYEENGRRISRIEAV